jgi:hypothetical protein
MNEEDKLIEYAIQTNGTHYDVAKIVYLNFKDKYKAIDKKTWYRYDNNKWIKTKEEYLDLRKELSEEIFKKFIDKAYYYDNKMYLTTDEGQKQIYENKAKSAFKISLRLRQSGYKDNIMKECRYLFLDEKLKDILTTQDQ